VAPRKTLRVGTGTFEVAGAVQNLDLTSASVWRQIALLDGVPVAQIDLASPGIASARLADALLTRRVMYWRARALLTDEVSRRLGLWDRDDRGSRPPLTISVIVCTHGRPERLAPVLAGLRSLDPAPLEVIIVDNAPGERDCRAEVIAAGFRYVLEPRRGLDNARNAGLRVARGDLIAFTDDDCLPSPGWLRPLPELFEDPTVGGVTGPMFPLRLETRAHQRMEQIAGMGRGFERTVFDWRRVSVAHASAIGVGANMTFRRSVLAELGPEPFPPELDVGTPTESGGDTYVIARLLARNHRIVYAPEVYGFHDHRGDDSALRRAVRGYGIGISAAMSKLLLEDREMETWRGWTWLVHQHYRVLAGWLVGRGDWEDVRLSRLYVAGGLRGPWRWWRSQRTEARFGPALATDPGGEVAGVGQRGRAVPASPVPRTAARAAVGAAVPDRSPLITVVLPTGRFGGPLEDCLRALAAQSLEPECFEVVIVDDRSDPPPIAPTDLPPLAAPVSILNSHGQGASAARNLGARAAAAPVVLFLDDDMVADAELLERHLGHQVGGLPCAVVGSYDPYPRDPGLAGMATALWWSDTFEAMRRHAGIPTFVWMLSGNLSVTRAEFLEIGGFSKTIPFRREDWELGLRWLERGYRLIYEPRAAARHEFSLSTRDRLRGVELEGFGDAVINREYPGSAGALPLLWHRPLRRAPAPRTIVHGLLEVSAVVNGATHVLDLLERAHLRLAWLRLMSGLSSGMYKQGLKRAGFRTAEVSERFIDFDLSANERVDENVPPVAPTLRLSFAGRPIGDVRPDEGFWDAGLAEQIVQWVAADDLERLAVTRGWVAYSDLPADAGSPGAIGVSDRVTLLDPEAVADGAAWRRVIEETDSELVAVVLAGRPEGNRWLDEALVPFDGDWVAAAFGRRVSDDRPAQPIYLHNAAMPPAQRAAHSPLYLVARVRALRELGSIPTASPRSGPLGAALALVAALLSSGWTVASRDLHGLTPPSRESAFVQGRAWAAAELAVWEPPPRIIAKRLAMIPARAYRDVRSGGSPAALVGEALGAVTAVADIIGNRHNPTGRRRTQPTTARSVEPILKSRK
jgi:glycosyltransferase involved in cell wall biosynthesis